MRGTDTKQASLLTLMTPEHRVPIGHPLRVVKDLAEAVLKEMSPTFDAMYSAMGRPSIPPERLLKATLLMALYTIRSERMFCEQLDYNILFRWFLDMNMVEPSFVPTVFSKNRDPDIHGLAAPGRRRQAALLQQPCIWHMGVRYPNPGHGRPAQPRW
jgi:transposase